MGTWRVVAVGAWVLAVALLAGCGGDDSSSSGKTVSKAVFIKKVDAICQKGNERVQLALLRYLKSHKDVKRPSRTESEKLIGTAFVPSVEQEIKEVRAVGVPEGDEDRIEAMVEALEEGVETAERDPSAVVNSSDVIFGIASRLAGEYGLKVCGTR